MHQDSYEYLKFDGVTMCSNEEDEEFLQIHQPFLIVKPPPSSKPKTAAILKVLILR